MGYQQSLRASEMGLTLNVDVASTAFVEPQPVPLTAPSSLHLGNRTATRAPPSAACVTSMDVLQ
jgi:Argonaute linker 1 domain